MMQADTHIDKDAIRYNVVRTLKPTQFTSVFTKAIEWDVQFDALVDRLADGRMRFTDGGELVRTDDGRIRQ
jgi:hypothetical protein